MRAVIMRELSERLQNQEYWEIMRDIITASLDGDRCVFHTGTHEMIKKYLVKEGYEVRLVGKNQVTEISW